MRNRAPFASVLPLALLLQSCSPSALSPTPTLQPVTTARDVTSTPSSTPAPSDTPLPTVASKPSPTATPIHVATHEAAPGIFGMGCLQASTYLEAKGFTFWPPDTADRIMAFDDGLGSLGFTCTKQGGIAVNSLIADESRPLSQVDQNLVGDFFLAAGVPSETANSIFNRAYFAGSGDRTAIDGFLVRVQADGKTWMLDVTWQD